MEPIVVLVLAISAVAAAAIVAMRRSRRPLGQDGAPSEDGPEIGTPPPGSTGPRRLAPARIVVVGGPRPSTGLRPHEPAQRPGPLGGPRRRLLRDASAVLFAIAGLALGASILTPTSGPAGGVLSAAGTPAGGEGAATTAGEAADTPPNAPGVDAGTRVTPSPSRTAPATAGAPSVPPDAASAASTAEASAAAGAATEPASREPGVADVPSSSRLALLTRCPGRSDCYLYVVRRGDTLLRVATFFGIAPAAILRLNPAITDPSIVVRGSTLVLPTPTR